MQRIDKWLVYARFAKHRSRACALIEAGSVRVNRIKVSKSSHSVKPGDVLTLAIGSHVSVVKVLAEPKSRGPAAVSSQVYEIVRHLSVDDSAEGHSQKPDASSAGPC